jgi:hypothetical protein
MNICIHAEADLCKPEELFFFAVPYLGQVLVCRECRRELALRTVERPHGLVPADLGRIGYRCSRCGGDYTSTDAMTCRCPGRKEQCEQANQLVNEWMTYRELVS